MDQQTRSPREQNEHISNASPVTNPNPDNVSNITADVNTSEISARSLAQRLRRERERMHKASNASNQSTVYNPNQDNASDSEISAHTLAQRLRRERERMQKPSNTVSSNQQPIVSNSTVPNPKRSRFLFHFGSSSQNLQDFNSQLLAFSATPVTPSLVDLTSIRSGEAIQDRCNITNQIPQGESSNM